MASRLFRNAVRTRSIVKATAFSTASFAVVRDHQQEQDERAKLPHEKTLTLVRKHAQGDEDDKDDDATTASAAIHKLSIAIPGRVTIAYRDVAPNDEHVAGEIRLCSHDRRVLDDIELVHTRKHGLELRCKHKRGFFSVASLRGDNDNLVADIDVFDRHALQSVSVSGAANVGVVADQLLATNNNNNDDVGGGGELAAGLHAGDKYWLQVCSGSVNCCRVAGGS